MRKPKQIYSVDDAMRVHEHSHAVTDRIRTAWSNHGKKEVVAAHFEQVMAIKNAMAVFAFLRLPIITHPNFRKYGYQIFTAHALPKALAGVLTDWEMQQLFHKVACEHTITHVQQVVSNRTFHTAQGALVMDRGKARWKSHRHYGGLATMLNAIRFRLPQAEDASVPEKAKSAWERYSTKYGRDRLIALLHAHQENVNRRLHPVHYTTGSYMKAAMFNKNSGKPTWHSHWFRKEQCKRYQDWYLFKTPGWQKAFPLAVNYGYHNKNYDIRKEHWVTLNRHGEVDIGLVYNRTDVLMEPRAAVAFDLNVKTNLFAASTGVLIHLEEDWLKRHEAKLAALERKGYQHLDTEEKLRLKRITKHRESSLRNQIQQVLLQCKQEGVTDIVLESLTITLGGGLTRRMHKLLRLLRFGTIRTWMREQAHKLGLRIHDLPAAFSSQACRCGHVDHANRTEQKFHCKVCGATAHADTHAADSLLWLFEQLRDVLAEDGFLSINAFGEYVATAKAKKSYKAIKAYYERKTGASHIQGGMLVINQRALWDGYNPPHSWGGT
ncbi:transposase [Acidithiobacillus sp. MC6.1]|nr:transposase [Acidithiobacillus sp. MC6.1]